MSSATTHNAHFDITNIHTIKFPLPKSNFKRQKDRRFFVAVIDEQGKELKRSPEVQMDGQSLLWNETLTGFMLGPSSRLELRVFEKHRIRSNECLTTCFLSFEDLTSSQTTFVLQDVGPKSSSQLRTISLSVFHVEASHIVQRAKDELDNIQAGPSTVNGAVETIDSVLETTNRIADVRPLLEKCKVVGDRIEFVMKAVDTIAEIHPYAKLAWSVVSLIPKMISKQIQLDQNVMDLLDRIEQALHLAPATETFDAETLRSRCKQSEKRKKTVIQLMDLIAECGYFIQSYAQNTDFWKRLIINRSRNTTATIADLRDQLQKLHDAFIDETVVIIDINVQQILGQVEHISEKMEEQDLGAKFPYVPGTRFNPDKGCLEGTRVKILEAITDWVNNVEPPSNVLVLFGQAGTGKSSIAHEIARTFDACGRLMTSYCFVRDVTSRDPYRFFTTLARNLCSRYPKFKTALDTILKTKSDILAATDYTTLFSSLIVEPLKDLQFITPVVIVLDALDESDDAKRTGPDTFHTFLAKHACQLPSNFRILMTSRPEDTIMKAFPASSFGQMFMNDSELAPPKEVEEDIYVYIQKRLCEAGIDDTILRELAKKAEGLFQWAFVACSYIAEPPPGLEVEDCIERVLNPTGGKESLAPLDAIYMTILERFNMDDLHIGNNFRSIMGQILGVFEPLSIDALDSLRKVSSNKSGRTKVSSVVKYVGSLLSNVTPESSGHPISPLHTSFRDFLTDRNRCDKFCVDLHAARGQLASATVETMRTLLHFNMCKLDTSYYLNSKVAELDKRVAEHIPSALSYSCRFWAKHLTFVYEAEMELLSRLQAFMEEKFLFWLEVLSVMEEVPIALTALLELRAWLGRSRNKNERLDTIVEDATVFIRYFGYPIAQSVPHIYISALPFAPSSSCVAKLYSPRFSHIIGVKRGRLAQWPALELTISIPRSQVSSVAWSNDGKYIATGLRYGQIFVWNVSTGMTVSGWYGVEASSTNNSNGSSNQSIYSKDISAITFSPGGLYLASGSVNGRIRIWGLMIGKGLTGEGKPGHLEGHTDVVWALSFSQDGNLLVSGSADCTVRVWDARKRVVVAGPFSGHNAIWAVWFLEDQIHIASRSGSRTVQVWNLQSGQKMTTPFESNISTGVVKSAMLDMHNIYFSSHVKESAFVACSWTEAMEGEKDESDPPTYQRPIAAFSPDGRFVATHDTQIRIWYASGGLAGTVAGGPFGDDRVLCLGFSADGQRVVSGSSDGAVRIWNVTSEPMTTKLTEDPKSVAFTEIEEQIVAGFASRVTVLNTSNGQEVLRLNIPRSRMVAVSQNGDLIAWTTQQGVHVRSIQTGNTVICPMRHYYLIDILAFCPTSNDLVAFGTSTRTVDLWDARTGALIMETRQFESTLLSLAISCLNNDSDGTAWTQIAVGTSGGSFIWDSLAGDVKGPFHHHGSSKVGALVISANGIHVTSAASDYSLCIWDSTDGKVVRGPVRWGGEQGEEWNPIALTQNGQRVAFVGQYSRILLFDVLYVDDKELALQGPLVLRGHMDSVKTLAFSRSGRLLATASWDRTIRIWDIQAAAARSQSLNNSASDDLKAINWDETYIDDNGWLTYDFDGSPLRLIWIPELHRRSLYRPSNVSVLEDGGSIATCLDFEGSAHGREWIRCYEGT